VLDWRTGLGREGRLSSKKYEFGKYVPKSRGCGEPVVILGPVGNKRGGIMPNEPLHLEFGGLQDSLDAFYERLDGDSKFRDRFLENPAGVISEEVPLFAEVLDPGASARASRVLYSLLSNKDFVAWAKKWSEQHAADVSTKPDGTKTLDVDIEQLQRELADAITKYGDKEALHSLLDLHGDGPPSRTLAPSDVGLSPNLVSNFQAPSWKPSVVSHNVVAAATFIAAAGVVVAVGVALPVYAFGLRAPVEGPNRPHLAEVVDNLTKQLTSRANQLREDGKLGPASSDNE
jgi:hypothetical protein